MNRGALTAVSLRRPMSLGDIRDGGVYRAPEAPLVQSNLFLRMTCLDGVYVKIPSKTGFDDYRAYVRDGRATAADIRPLDEAERFDRLAETVSTYPPLRPIADHHPEVAHYLAVHWLQHDRLRRSGTVGIPTVRFGVLRSGWFGRTVEPALFQERVEGATLWDMFDFDALEVRPAYQRHVPAIAAQLAPLVNSPLVDHVDWNIQNFVFRERDGRLFYVDVKPTTFVARQSNEHNLEGIRQYFAA